MDSKTIFTKTAKGLGETVGKTKALSRGLRKVLKEVDGQTRFEQLQAQLDDMPEDKLEAALSELLKGDYIREFRSSETETASADDLDFSTAAMFPETLAQLTIGAYLRAVEEAPKDDEDAKKKARAGHAGQPNVKEKDNGPATIRARWQRDAVRYNEETVERAKPLPPPPSDEKNEHVRRMEEAARQAEKEILSREAELKARREAEAKAKKEAEEKARLEAEAKAKREAEERARAEAAARHAAEEKARAEAEVRRAVEEKARREAEAKAKREAEEAARKVAEERARREAEEKARREAEEKARREAEARARREAEEAARKEAEERARREREEKARREAEEKARREAEAKAKREAEEVARKAAEERARREAEEKARREAEARAREEQERARREEQERKERERKEAEERAAKEAQERAKRKAAEDEARRLAEEQARTEAENARLAAELKKEQEERLRREAELQKQKELRELEARVETERKRLEAEKAAREDHEARERLKAEEKERRRAEEKANLIAEALARKQIREEERRKAEEDAKKAAEERANKKAEEKARRKSEKEAKRAAKEQVRLDEEEQDRQELYEHRPVQLERMLPTVRLPNLKPVLGILVVGLMIAAVAGVFSIHWISFDKQAALFEKEVSAQFHQPVKIGAVHFELLPRPHWHIENVVIGDRAQIKATDVVVNQPFGKWFDDQPVIESVEISSPVLTDESMEWIVFGKPPAGNLHLGHVVASSVKWEPAKERFGMFDIDAQMGNDGAWRSMTLFSSDRQTQLEFHPDGDAIRMELTAENFPMPFGAKFALSSVHAIGVLHHDRLDLNEFTSMLYGGTITGNATLDWSAGWSLQGAMHAKYVNAAALAPAVFGEGHVQGDAKFAMRSPEMGKLFSAPQADGSFTATSGTVTGVDLIDLFKGPLKGGRSAFTDFAGTFTYADGKTQLRGLRMKGGLVSAAGYANVGETNNLDGHFIVDLKSDLTRQHADLAVSGTLDAPRFAR